MSEELRHFGTAWLLQLPMDSGGFDMSRILHPTGKNWRRRQMGEGMMHHHVPDLATRDLGAAWTRETALCLFHRKSPRETPTRLCV